MRIKIVVAAFLTGLLVNVSVADEGWLLFPAKEGAGQGKHIALLAGDEEYRSEEAMPMLGKILSQHHGFKCTVHFSVNEAGEIDPANQESVTGSEQLQHADAIVMSLRFRQWPEEDRKNFTDAIERGIPLIGLRTSTHAFRGPLRTFGKDVLGENWVNHWGGHKRQATRGVVEPAAVGHEILSGVADVFGNSDVYEAYPPEDATILLRGVVLKGMEPDSEPATHEKNRSRGDKGKQGVNDPAMPVLWTREHEHASGNTSRVVCTTLGAATDFKSEGLRRVVVNSVFWGLKLDVPESANVEFVDKYEPTMYGFGTFRKGERPENHKLGSALLAPSSP